MMNVVQYSIETIENKFKVKIDESKNIINNGVRQNVFKVVFLDNKFNILTNTLFDIISLFNQEKQEFKIKYEMVPYFFSKFVKSVTIPDHLISNTQEIHLPFLTKKVASNRQSFDNITISFVEPFGMLIKQFFKYYIFKNIINPWFNFINDAEKYKFAIMIIHYSTIAKDLSDSGENLSNVTLHNAKKYIFYGVFPVTINGVNLAYDSTELVQTDVTFAYDQYVCDELLNVTVNDIQQIIEEQTKTSSGGAFYDNNENLGSKITF